MTVRGLVRTWTMLVAVVIALTSVAVSAHDNYRVIGTITRVNATRLDVKQTRDGREFSMRMDRGTVVTRDKKKVAIGELAVGLHVVVDASGDAIDDLLVSDVLIVPPPTKR